MRAKLDNHFATRKHIEEEKQNAIENQKRIKDLENRFLDNLENQVYAGDYNTEKIIEATEAIKNLRNLSEELPKVDTESIKQPHLRTSEELAINDRQLNSLESELQLENDAYENKMKKIEMATKDAKKSEIDSEISAIRTKITQEKDINKQEEREYYYGSTNDIRKKKSICRDFRSAKKYGSKICRKNTTRFNRIF